MDFIDRLIRRNASALHEKQRLQAVARRHEQDQRATANVLYDRIKDRVLFHFPVTRRDQRSDLSDQQFARLQAEEWAHRNALILSIVVEMASDSDENPFQDRSLDF